MIPVYDFGDSAGDKENPIEDPIYTRQTPTLSACSFPAFRNKLHNGDAETLDFGADRSGGRRSLIQPLHKARYAVFE